MMKAEELLQRAESSAEWLQEIRHHLHRHPELSFKEENTSAYIASLLDKMDIPYKRGIVKTGIVARIDGRQPGPCIALRADMDALPVTEATQLPCTSVNHGVMHACGHDIHMTSLLGAARLLNDLRQHFDGTVLLIFQPGEELIPGGANLMLKEGIFDKQEPQLIIGQHVEPTMKVGTVGMKPGVYMASNDEIYLTIRGKGGHAAMPHQLTDIVLVTSHIIVALQQIVSRNAQASTPTVLSFGKVIANGATNIIPSEVKVEGTFRTMNEDWRAEAHRRIQHMASGIAESMGATCEVRIAPGYPVLCNHVASTHKAMHFAGQILGEKNVEPLEIRMTSEDFAYFALDYPSVFYRLGVKPDNGEVYSLHTSQFAGNEKALPVGAATMAWLTLSFLKDLQENE
jgi:amidohydrolase